MPHHLRRFSALSGLMLPAVLWAQSPPPPAPAAAVEELAREDHADMLKQLGITRLRPGPSGRAADANAANYDPTRANPYPDWPDALTLKDGRQVTSADMWWRRRRPEIVEDFEREVYGRVPGDVPKVTWAIAETVETTVGGQPVVARRVIGHVDNSAHPAIKVDVKMAVVLPVNAKGPAPVLMMFGAGNMPGEPQPRFGNAQEPAAPPSAEQLIASGWGYVSLSPASIQADDGAGLTAGIIGLTNKGRRRTPEQWGSLRAWAWGAARALDYLETLAAVDAKRVGIEGVSRYGKAALVTMAFEPRFALALVGSSGEGGAKPHRRNFGEAVENLTGSGEYHWMAGKFLKYGAAEGAFGSKNASDIPVDAHELIALCAPRPTFISYGIPEKGDANWLDQQGSYMATVAAGAVFRLLGARDIGATEDYRVAKMPPHDTSLLEGELAWRQHDGGHEDRSNMSFFIAWANRLLHHTPPPVPADQPRMRADRNSHVAHQQLLAKARSGGIDVYFLGDSITRRWGALDYPDFLAHWRKSFHGWNAANFGWGGDRTENVLWRLENGELDGVNPKVIVLLAGTNNVGKEPGDDAKIADVTRGLKAIVDSCRRKAPASTIVLTAVFPRNDNPAVVPTIERINANLAKMADGKSVRFLDVNPRLAEPNGVLFDGMMVDGLHPGLEGYEVWAAGLKPILAELLGPPAITDHAPPPTGDPSAAPGQAQAHEVDTYAAAFIDKHKIPGLSLAVVQDGKVVKAAGYGFANLELNSPATPETAWEIGSITKHFTAEAVMLLVQDDKLRLDDTLGQHLDGVPPAWQPLTLRQLLTHTSGLKDWETEGLLNFHREYTDAEYIALMSPFALEFKPGEHWSYTNTAYPLLGMVIARVSGKPYDEFVKERIFKPLGMDATRFSHPLEIVPRRASGYVDDGGRLRKGEPLRPRIVEPNGAILASVLDLAKWARAFEDGALLKRESLIQMVTPVRLNDGSTFISGFGIFVTQFRGHRLFLHNGSTPGGFSSVFYHYPDDKLTVFVLCNVDRGDAVNKLATRVASFFVPGLDVRSLTEQTDPDPKTTQALLAMLRDLADKKGTTLASPRYKMSDANRARVAAQLAGLRRFAFLDREARPKAADGPAQSAPAVLRYKLVGDKQTFYYTIQMTADGTVADLDFEEE